MSRAHGILKNTVNSFGQNVTSHATLPEKQVQILQTNTQSAKNVQFPKLELVTFDGSFEKWFGFYDYFRNGIHKYERLSNSNELSYS